MVVIVATMLVLVAVTLTVKALPTAACSAQLSSEGAVKASGSFGPSTRSNVSVMVS